ncbi:non-specific lipid-transfer protein 1-like [Salvia miltiorrhiza]|uniref:non-specific lipid-transfer protein 1-like n=1 Tax=Salvia miltiorrhiza TaxID=226208 RepID=UPI0025ACA68F|nr:non-specific lipid-transfer protein 1-like [Salvia miltiorrhiza]XP_057804318.1 non-specific lipid-transfer protein 1-like [Salvia miltiorrhiza]
MEKATIQLFLAAIMVVAALAPPHAEAAISCNTVATDLSPCINYVLYGGAPVPPVNCCQGIKSLYNQASATADRQAVCSCLKSVASSATPAIVTNAAALPGKCGVSIPYKISPSTDCSTVH